MAHQIMTNVLLLLVSLLHVFCKELFWCSSLVIIFQNLLRSSSSNFQLLASLLSSADTFCRCIYRYRPYLRNISLFHGLNARAIDRIRIESRNVTRRDMQFNIRRTEAMVCITQINYVLSSLNGISFFLHPIPNRPRSPKEAQQRTV